MINLLSKTDEIIKVVNLGILKIKTWFVDKDLENDEFS